MSSVGATGINGLKLIGKANGNFSKSSNYFKGRLIEQDLAYLAAPVITLTTQLAGSWLAQQKRKQQRLVPTKVKVKKRKPLTKLYQSTRYPATKILTGITNYVKAVSKIVLPKNIRNLFGRK